MNQKILCKYDMNDAQRSWQLNKGLEQIDNILLNLIYLKCPKEKKNVCTQAVEKE